MTHLLLNSLHMLKGAGGIFGCGACLTSRCEFLHNSDIIMKQFKTILLFKGTCLQNVVPGLFISVPTNFSVIITLKYPSPPPLSQTILICNTSEKVWALIYQFPNLRTDSHKEEVAISYLLRYVTVSQRIWFLFGSFVKKLPASFLLLPVWWLYLNNCENQEFSIF